MCPTNATVEYLKSKKIFKNDIFCLEDPVLQIRKVPQKKFDKTLDPKFAKENIILIGRLTKQKNFGLFVNAFSKIVKKYPDLKANILGDGELKDDLKKLIDNLGLSENVILLGHKENVFKYLFNSKIFILTSLWEDPGFVILEAALSNTLIISSNCPNGPDEILSNGLNGFLFKNNDISDLLNKFDKFKNSTEDELKKKKISAKKQLKMFTQFAYFKSLENIIELNDKKN